MIFQLGTAMGKLPAVTIPTTPKGRRYVVRSLFGISEGTVCPYSRLPSDWKKWQVSMASCTSPRASLSVLPISRVTRRDRASFSRSSALPSVPMSPPRTGAGVLDQRLNASFATRHASRTCSLVASGKVPTTSLWFDELRDSKVSWLETSFPPMRLAKVLTAVCGITRSF